MISAHWRTFLAAAALAAGLGMPASAQVPPGAVEIAAYDGLHKAAATGDVETVRALVAAGANLDARDAHGRTALMVAAHFGHHAAAQALIEAIVLGNGGARHIATVDALVTAGADVNLADGRGIRPLSLARERGYDDIVRILEAAGAKP
jgi:ankyrin repeat protein